MKARMLRIQMFILDNLAWFLIIFFYLMFAILKPAMLDMSFITFMLYSSVPVGLLVLAESIVLLSGNFDLSIDRITGFSAMLAGKLITMYSISAELAMPLPLIFGTLCGSLNGFLVGYLGLNPFIVTLGTYMAFSGAILVVSPTSIWHLPELYILPGKDMIISMLSFGLILILLAFFLKYFRTGRSIYMVGGNPQAALMLGVDVKKVTFLAFTLGGLLCGIAALIFTGFNASVPVNIASGYTFTAFAAAVLGGISLRGGRGSVLNAFAGTLLLSVINAGLVLFAIREEVRWIITGALVVSALLIDKARETVRARVARII
jgi:ribose/xylose/arabinose/galactoside ABC-type transport system permease subunit